MVKSPSGYPIQSPYVSIANRQAEIMMRIALAANRGSRSDCSIALKDQRARPEIDQPQEPNTASLVVPCQQRRRRYEMTTFRNLVRESGLTFGFITSVLTIALITLGVL